jgi:phospholipid transport system substrate-binding protein
MHDRPKQTLEPPLAIPVCHMGRQAMRREDRPCPSQGTKGRSVFFGKRKQGSEQRRLHCEMMKEHPVTDEATLVQTIEKLPGNGFPGGIANRPQHADRKVRRCRRTGNGSTFHIDRQRPCLLKHAAFIIGREQGRTGGDDWTAPDRKSGRGQHCTGTYDEVGIGLPVPRPLPAIETQQFGGHHQVACAQEGIQPPAEAHRGDGIKPFRNHPVGSGGGIFLPHPRLHGNKKRAVIKARSKNRPTIDPLPGFSTQYLTRLARNCKDKSQCGFHERSSDSFRGSIMSTLKHIGQVAIILVLFFEPALGRGQPPEAVAVVKRFSDALLNMIRRADALGLSGRFKYLRPHVQDSFAIPLMAKISVGKYWETLTSEEREELIRDYLDWATANYARQFDGYSGETFQVKSGVESDQRKASVVSQMIKPDGDRTEFDYVLLERKGRWQIIDIRVEGVSQLAVTRAQMVSVIEKNGFQGLIRDFQDKIQDISQAR